MLAIKIRIVLAKTLDITFISFSQRLSHIIYWIIPLIVSPFEIISDIWHRFTFSISDFSSLKAIWLLI